MKWQAAHMYTASERN